MTLFLIPTKQYHITRTLYSLLYPILSTQYHEYCILDPSSTSQYTVLRTQHPLPTVYYNQCFVYLCTASRTLFLLPSTQYHAPNTLYPLHSMFTKCVLPCTLRTAYRTLLLLFFTQYSVPRNLYPLHSILHPMSCIQYSYTASRTLILLASKQYPVPKTLYPNIRA